MTYEKLPSRMDVISLRGHKWAKGVVVDDKICYTGANGV